MLRHAACVIFLAAPTWGAFKAAPIRVTGTGHIPKIRITPTPLSAPAGGALISPRLLISAAPEIQKAPALKNAVVSLPPSVMTAPAKRGLSLGSRWWRHKERRKNRLRTKRAKSIAENLDWMFDRRSWGNVGPGVDQEHIEALGRLADRSGVTFFIMGSRQTGVNHRDGAPYKKEADLDVGVIGGYESMDRAWKTDWTDVPNMDRGPVYLRRSVEEAIGEGFLVIPPRPEPPKIKVSRLVRRVVDFAKPFKTSAQLERLVRSPRGNDETFSFSLVGDAEPGRFWFTRLLFNFKKQSVFSEFLGRTESEETDFTFQIGDMVSRGTVRKFRNFFSLLSRRIVDKPYLTTIGNHDRRKPHGVTDNKVYRSLFGSTDYYFDHGGARFVVLDTSAGRLSVAQLTWFQAALRTDRRKIVFTHMPPTQLSHWTDYPFAKGAGGFKLGADEFEGIVSAAGVDRVYVGHIHALGVLDHGGVRYVLTGGGGSPLFPTKIKDVFHHYLKVDVGPEGITETVVKADGERIPLPEPPEG